MGIHCAGVPQQSLPVSLQAFLDRYQQRSRASRRTADMRASVFPIPLPKPGERALASWAVMHHHTQWQHTAQ